jgi:hypothetical protein
LSQKDRPAGRAAGGAAGFGREPVVGVLADMTRFSISTRPTRGTVFANAQIGFWFFNFGFWILDTKPRLECAVGRHLAAWRRIGYRICPVLSVDDSTHPADRTNGPKRFIRGGCVGTKKTGKGRRKLGRKKRRMRAKIRHRKK